MGEQTPFLVQVEVLGPAEALWWLLALQLQIDLPTAGWFLAGGLIMFGVFGLIGSIRPRRQIDPTSPAAGSLEGIGSDPEPW